MYAQSLSAEETVSRCPAPERSLGSDLFRSGLPHSAASLRMTTTIRIRAHAVTSIAMTSCGSVDAPASMRRMGANVGDGRRKFVATRTIAGMLSTDRDVGYVCSRCVCKAQ